MTLVQVYEGMVVGENARVGRALAFLAAGDGAGFGELLNESHESSRKNFENSTPELDQLAAIAQQIPGVLGARLTGGKFCPECGQPVAQKKFCTECGKEIQAGVKFCPECGAKQGA